MTQEQMDEFVTGGKCVAKRNAYTLTNKTGKWISDERDECRLLTMGKQYNICLKGIRSIKVIDDKGDASIWTFQSEDTNYSFPFYTKEELRESILGEILK
jgi:hypothetical protein